MLNAFYAPDALHICAQDGEGNKRIIRYIREDHIDNFVDATRRKLECLKERADRMEANKEERHEYSDN